MFSLRGAIFRLNIFARGFVVTKPDTIALTWRCGLGERCFVVKGCRGVRMFCLSCDIDHAVANISSNVFEGMSGVMLSSISSSSSEDTLWSAGYSVDNIMLCPFKNIMHAAHSCNNSNVKKSCVRRL